MRLLIVYESWSIFLQNVAVLCKDTRYCSFMYILKLTFLLGFSLFHIKNSISLSAPSHYRTTPTLSAPSHFRTTPAQSALLSRTAPGGGGYGIEWICCRWW